MYKPNYEKNNIINLMSSISSSLGVKSDYNEIDIDGLANYKNIILIVIDGLGYNYLMEHDSFLKKNCVNKLEGAFPLTTAASNTAFSLGVPPQQHGLTGWFVFLKEVGAITTVLPFTERYFGSDLDKAGFSIKDIIRANPYTNRANRATYKVMDKNYSHSAFSLAASEGSTIIGVTPYKETFEKVQELTLKEEDKFIHAYVGEFDSSGHAVGIQSKETEEIFYEIDHLIEDLSSKIKDSIILVTADHGMLDTDDEHLIKFDDYPEIQECLSIPLSGDSRIGYCYLRNGFEKKFMMLITKHLGDKVYLFKSESMIKNNWFGLGEEHPMLKHRVGDYTIISKEKYMIYDNLGHEDRVPHVGHHSGISDDEVYVPLSIIRR